MRREGGLKQLWAQFVASETPLRHRRSSDWEMYLNDLNNCEGSTNLLTGDDKMSPTGFIVEGTMGMNKPSVFNESQHPSITTTLT